MYVGVDGGIDFDTMRVNEEQKQVCTLKNKGKYDIAYVYVLYSDVILLVVNSVILWRVGHKLVFTLTENT